MKFPVEARLKDGTPIELVLADQIDVLPLQRLYQQIVNEGTSYPHDRMPDDDAFYEYWFRSKTTVGAYGRNARHAKDAEMLGAFYLKANWPGRAKHVANAGFVVAPDWRNRGLGWLLGATMLEYARMLGYRSVIFNLVFARNEPALQLWGRLGFQELGRIPSAVRNDDGSYQDAVIMWRSLTEESSQRSAISL